jgi:hypothetical protein
MRQHASHVTESALRSSRDPNILLHHPDCEHNSHGAVRSKRVKRRYLGFGIDDRLIRHRATADSYRDYGS